MYFVQHTGAKVNTVESIYFFLEVHILLRPLTSVSYILTVSNCKVCSNDGLVFGLFNQVSDLGSHGPLVYFCFGHFFR